MERSKNKKRIVILRGGPSEEYDISMITGAGIIEALENHPRLYPIDVVVTKRGEWLVDGHVREPKHVLESIDCAFLAFHGSYGEDGTVQRLLERYNIPYTGSGPYASAIAMNKILTKDYLKELDIKMPPHMSVSRDSVKNVHDLAQSISELFAPEYVVKPVNGGSSCGVIIAKNSAELSTAISKNLENYEQVLVEKRIHGKEATCGVIENFRGSSLYSLPVIEIVPPANADYFDRENKYDGTTEEICPGRFSKSEKDEIEKISLQVHETLGLSQYSRSDFIVGDERQGQTSGIYFLEVNTLPGMTPESLMPLAVDAVGLSYLGFIEHLLDDALKG